MKVAVIEYDIGNVKSVCNAVSILGIDVTLEGKAKNLKNYDYVVLPGVGSFSTAIDKLNSRGWADELYHHIFCKERPFLGICLGMQILATVGTEGEKKAGFNWIEGEVVKLKIKDKQLRMPHIGWNEVNVIKESQLYSNYNNPNCFYFVHSYHLLPKDDTIITGTCNYGDTFVASIQKDNIFATQYHPEKSHESGLKVIKSFLSQ